ncbi:MAG: hypothetical protein HC780_00660 [Leptolyngbyaceae cyanobacterium CSU_1_3]|nr:hypothetical protein [Leptolyngbyaceae cyanobacterium CSU_1_3]
MMGVKVLQGSHVTLTALSPNGQRLGGSSRKSRDWHGKLAVEGDYTIEVASTKAGDYALSFEIY